MFQSPDHYHNLSLRLSDVLSDIGVNERMVTMRRRTFLLKETMMNMHYQLIGLTFNETIFNFGSQTEASTTVDINSDFDTLVCMKANSVIQDWTEWMLNKRQFLMVQDETISPGYCLLQAVRSDMPLPVRASMQNQCFTTDSRGRVLMRHSVWFKRMLNQSIRHGPAQSVSVGFDHQLDADIVIAFYCTSWPKKAESWLLQQNVSGWPTEDIIKYAVENGCFLVPVASHASVNQDTEWRISTSFAERCLMLSLNMTQIRCYILMKMINKTYLKPKIGETISSFMCKNVLFHCIADTRASEWIDSNLLPCLNQCLQYLLHCILTANCPHFIIPGNNLLAGKLSFHTKQQLVEIMMALTTNIEQTLLGITVDELGNRLYVKFNSMVLNYVTPSKVITVWVLFNNVSHLTGMIHSLLRHILKTNTHNTVGDVFQVVAQNVSKMCIIHSAGSRLEQAACCFYAPTLCAVVGSIIASVNIHHDQSLSTAALQWFSAGLNSDFSSSRLKLASALYCAGHHEHCETILKHLNRQLEQTAVLTACCCTVVSVGISEELTRICEEKNEVSVIQQNTAFCVSFLPCEVNCVPEELRYEMFRSTQEELPYRGEYDYWMDWAVVDSIPFLYFLQYKVYKQLYRPAQQQQQALRNLFMTINNEPNLGHRETALNLLGQCMEEENRTDEALCCFMMSLNVKPSHNAAKWHFCKLLARLVNN